MRLAGGQKQPRNTYRHDRLTPVSTPESSAGLELVQGSSSIEEHSISTTDATQLTVANAQTSFPGPMTDSHFLVMSDMTACAALAVIAQRLQLHCRPIPGFNIQALTDDLPSAIVPTTCRRVYLIFLIWTCYPGRPSEITSSNQSPRSIRESSCQTCDSEVLESGEQCPGIRSDGKLVRTLRRNGGSCWTMASYRRPTSGGLKEERHHCH